MSSELLIHMDGAAKSYPQRPRPARELMARLWGRSHAQHHRYALQPMDLELRRGEAVGIVGLNGAGKSTLLQLAAGVLSPNQGRVTLSGRVAALLELGSAFDPEASGWDNIGLYAATLGLPGGFIEAQREAIIDFSGLRECIHAPVKSYSTGMQVRLAFSVATAVEPDVLIIDEALSVGDGVFAKRSFDRIMALRQRGAALLLSSHALFHVDLFCQKTLWLHGGAVRAWGDTPSVLPRYQEFLDQQAGPIAAAAPRAAEGSSTSSAEPAAAVSDSAPADAPRTFELAPTADPARLIGARVGLDGVTGAELQGRTGAGVLSVTFDIQASPAEIAPRAAVVLSSETGRILASSLSPPGAFVASGQAHRGTLRFEWVHPMLNRGRYRVGVYLLCAQGRYVYAWSDPHAHLQIEHDGPHQGAFILPGQWQAPTVHSAGGALSEPAGR
jgi:lipopolysaccharide transport system ATP-binding protein